MDFDDYDDSIDGDGNVVHSRHDSFWYSPTAEITKWSIVAVITLLLLLWFVGGYFHARRRVRKGLKPMRYHRFLLPRSQRGRSESQNNFSFYRQSQQGYPMDAYGPPPPVYNPNLAAPPSYAVPEGASKAAPSQAWIVPPPGAPPGASAATDVEQGVVPDTPKTAPAKNGRLGAFISKIPKLR